MANSRGISTLDVIKVLHDLRDLFGTESYNESHLVLVDVSGGRWSFFGEDTHLKVYYAPRRGDRQGFKFTSPEYLYTCITDTIGKSIPERVRELERYIQETSKGFSDVYKDIERLRSKLSLLETSENF